MEIINDAPYFIFLKSGKNGYLAKRYVHKMSQYPALPLFSIPNPA